MFVPVFKSITHLPPYMGMMVSLGVMWVLTEIIYDRKRGIEESIKCRVTKVLKHIDMPTILFFLGILMSVAALETAGVLTDVANWLDKQVHEVFTIAGVIGILSSVIDNVPLVAACMGMYPVMDTAAVAASADPAYMQSFVQDGLFWHLLTYCAGVGGSPADHRLGSRRGGDGARKDQFRVVFQEDHLAGLRRLCVGHPGDPARTPAGRALTGSGNGITGAGAMPPRPLYIKIRPAGPGVPHLRQRTLAMNFSRSTT